jgi:hypothetical protein
VSRKSARKPNGEKLGVDVGERTVLKSEQTQSRYLNSSKRYHTSVPNKPPVFFSSPHSIMKHSFSLRRTTASQTTTFGIYVITTRGLPGKHRNTGPHRHGRCCNCFTTTIKSPLDPPILVRILLQSHPSSRPRTFLTFFVDPKTLLSSRSARKRKTLLTTTA